MLLGQTLFILSIIIPGNLAFAQAGSFGDEVSSGRQMVETFEALANNPQTNKRALQKITIEISNNTEARNLLKSRGYESLASRYFGLWFDGKDALVGDLIERTRAKLLAEGYPLEVLVMITPVQNEASRRARKAPMDLDIGINTEGSKEQAMKVLKQLGGPKRVKTFENDLQKALEESYSEVAEQLGVRNIRPGKAIITGATHFHAEAYADAVLSERGIPGKDLIQQTADVSKYKVDYLKNRVGKVFSEEAAWKESARGTLKDLEKMERVFQNIEKTTGVIPKLSDVDLKVKGLLEKVAAETDGAVLQRLNKEITVLAGTDIFGACKILIDNMESVIRLKPTGILALDLLLKKIFREANPAKRLEIVQSQLAYVRKNPMNVAESQKKALEELERVITAVQGDTFLMKILKSPTGQMLVVSALVNAPFALYSMYQAYQQGELNDLSDAAAVLIDFVPGGISVKKSMTQGMTAGTVLSFAKEALYFTPAWPFVLTGDVLYMSIEIGTAMSVSNYQSGLVDLLVYNGKFEKGRLTHLELLDEKRVERADLEPFFFNTTYVAVKTSIPLPGWGLRINNLSEKAMEVYNEHYLKIDPVLEQLRNAAETQLGEINKAEAGKYLDIYNGNFIPGVAAAKYLVWLAGFDLLCNKSPEKWCKVFNLLKEKIEKRKEYVHKNIMIPDLIRMAEAKYATLNAAEDLSKKMGDLQKALEDLRGSPLGINLVDEINKKAEEKANAKDSKIFGATDTKETKKMTKGDYWQTAFPAYVKIYSETINIKTKIQKETGYENLPVLQIQWSGDYRQDQLRIAQSKDGFSDDSKKIHADIQGIKGSSADPQDTVDKQALDILGRVVFPMRSALDETNKAVPEDEKTAEFGAKRFPVPEKDSPFYKEYEEALKKVRELYGKKEDFQAQLKNGAQIVKKQDFLIFKEPSSFEIKFTDENLIKEWDKGALTLKWTAIPKDDFKPNDKSQTVNFTTFGLAPVTISVQVEKSGREKVTGTLIVVMPVKVPDDFLKLELKPAAPKPEEEAKAETTIPENFYGKGSKLHYKWSGTNCQVENVDRLSTTVMAPKSGAATVTVELFTGDAEGKWVSLTSKQVSFEVAGGKPDTPPGDKPKDDKTDKPQAPPVIPIPDSYTKGQIGIGKDTGVKTGADTQTGTTDTGKTDKGTTDTGKTDVGKTDISKTDIGKTEPTTTSKTDIGKTDTSKTDTGKTDTATGSKTPTCTYQYSEYGDCNRATKKQTRTVIGKGPAGCRETGKPDLEKDCTPPLTEEEKRLNYLNCLCRSSGGSLGGYYDPKNGKPCMAWGPLTGWGAGLPNDPKLVKSCYAGAYGKEPDDKDLKNSLDDIKKTNKKFIPPLKVKLNQEKCPIKAQLGDIVNFTVIAEGGVPPYKYSWSGNGQAKDNTFTFANTREPGSHPISVTVTDNEGDSVTASCPVNVEAVTVKIELLDKESKIPIGESRNFKGTVMSGDQPAKGDFYFLWQPHPEIAFSPFEKTGGNLSGTKATFKKLGKFKVWVIAHTYKGNVKTTVGESEQIEIEVSKPELKLAFQPQNPKVGQEVKLTVTEKPKMDDKTISFWWEISGSALNAGPLKNEREYTFRPKDTKPVTVTVHGKAGDGGDDLGEDKATIIAQAYEVKLGEPHHLPPKPRIWKCDTQLGKAKDCGIVELEKELAVFNDIFIKAGVTPEPEKTPLRYAWSVSPEGICGLPGAGQELKINCSQPGSYTVTVKVRDSQNVELGTASTQVGITITKDDLDKGKKHLVTLQADKLTLKTGETANIKANVQGGKTPYTYKWSEGLEGKTESVKFSPKKSGTQKVAVDVTDKSGAMSSASLDIKVEAAKLELSLQSDKPSTKTGQKVSLKAAVKGGEPEFSYKWSEGIEGKGDSTQFTPKKSGTQKITLEVTDGKGQKATATVDIKVEAPKLEAILKADKPTIKISETANIKAEVKGGEPPFTYKWKEGLEGKEESARFTPKKSGLQKVSLDITDAAGQKVSANLDIKVEAPKLEVALKADKSTIKVGETATIKAEVKGGEPAYAYKWSDGLEGKGDSARFTPKKAGAQKITLEVTDSTKQKGTASLEVKIEAPKLEVALSVDKRLLKTGETAKIQAVVKGGTPPYKFSWSSQVEGKVETANFSPKTAGFFKIYLEVQDADRKKVVGNLDLTVQEGKGDGKTSDTKEPGTKTSGTKSSDTKTIGQKESDSKDGSVTAKQIIEPDILKVAPGETGVFKAFETNKDGRKTEIPSSKISWKVEPYRGATIDRTGKVSLDKSSKPGTSIKVTALFEKSQAFGAIEITAASKTISTTKETGIRELTKTTKFIQPDPLQLSPGSSGLISLQERDDQGRTYPPADIGKLSWKLASNIKEITLKPQKDGVVVITATKSAKAGTKVRILAGLEKSQVAGTIEIIPSSDPATKVKETEKDTESKSTTVAKSSIPGEYNPLADPGLKSQTPPVDISKVDKFKDDFQQGQWATQEKKTKASSDGSQQNVQQQPTDYTNTTKKPVDQSSTSQTQTPIQTPTTDTTKTTTDTSKTSTDTTKTTTDTTKTTQSTQTSTQTATKTGIDVQVVGTAPSGKCLIVDGQLVPVKGYKENIANMTVTLTGPVNKTATSSASGTFKFPEIPAGNYIISVKQWNYGMTKQNFVAPSGKSVKIVLKGSCPFLYVWTGQNYEKENDIYSVARLLPQELLSEGARQLANKEGLFLSPVSLENIPEKLKKAKALKDYYRITRALVPDSEGNYRLRIVEQAEEHSFTDWVGLTAVDHRKGSKIGITREGRPFIYETLEPLAIQSPISFYNEETMEVQLPGEAFQRGVLTITWQGFLDGNPEGHSASAGRPQLALQRMNPQGQWQTVDWVYPRDEVQESFFLLKDLGPGWDQGGKIRLAAVSCHPEKYHRLDSLGLARLVAELPQVTHLKLLSATKSTGEAILKALQERDNRYLSLGPEESAGLIFQGTPIKTDMERSFIFVSEGFYIPLPLIRLTSH
ncbi:MAG: hypothetical protein V2B13_12960 [Pseudomonadota bacterium]